MDTIAATFPKSVVKKVDLLVASGLYLNRSEVLRAALRDLVLKERASKASRRSIAAFETRVRNLAKEARWRNRYVALYRGKPIDSDVDQDALLRRVLERREDPIHIVFAGRTERNRRD